MSLSSVMERRVLAVVGRSRRRGSPSTLDGGGEVAGEERAGDEAEEPTEGVVVDEEERAEEHSRGFHQAVDQSLVCLAVSLVSPEGLPSRRRPRRTSDELPQVPRALRTPRHPWRLLRQRLLSPFA